MQELYPDLQEEDNLVGNLRLPSGPKNSLRLDVPKSHKGTVCAKFNDSLIRLVQAMKRQVNLIVFHVSDSNGKRTNRFCMY